jgi:sugar lactone lactonase YvrE
VSKVTSVCFGGSDLTDLYVTSARAGLTQAQLHDEPHAGDVFVLPAAGHGSPGVRFDPSTIDHAGFVIAQSPGTASE